MINFLTRLLSPLLCLSALSASAATPLGEIRSWAVFYGESARPEQLTAPDLLVLEPDHPWQVEKFRREGQRVLAYLSLGEVNESRAYYRRVAGLPGAIAGKNPDWPGAHRVDPRSKGWQKLVVDTLAPSLLGKGYDGLFLDTLDTAAYLEAHGKPGSVKAMACLVKELHARFPQALIVANGGWDLLPEAAGALSGYVTESVFTNYQFKPAKYRRRGPEDAAARVARLQEVSQEYGLSVLVIEYVEPSDAAMRAEVAAQVRQAGFVPFVSDIGLSTLEPTP